MTTAEHLKRARECIHQASKINLQGVDGYLAVAIESLINILDEPVPTPPESRDTPPRQTFEAWLYSIGEVSYDPVSPWHRGAKSGWDAAIAFALRQIDETGEIASAVAANAASGAAGATTAAQGQMPAPHSRGPFPMWRCACGFYNHVSKTHCRHCSVARPTDAASAVEVKK